MCSVKKKITSTVVTQHTITVPCILLQQKHTKQQQNRLQKSVDKWESDNISYLYLMRRAPWTSCADSLVTWQANSSQLRGCTL